MYPFPCRIEEAVLFTADGKTFKLENMNLEDITYDPYSTDVYVQKHISLGFTDAVEFTMNIHNRRGMLDVFKGLNTPAARRYIRNSKRLKEKNRRMKLKGMNP